MANKYYLLLPTDIEDSHDLESETIEAEGLQIWNKGGPSSGATLSTTYILVGKHLTHGAKLFYGWNGQYYNLFMMIKQEDWQECFDNKYINGYTYRIRVTVSTGQINKVTQHQETYYTVDQITGGGSLNGWGYRDCLVIRFQSFWIGKTDISFLSDNYVDDALNVNIPLYSYSTNSDLTERVFPEVYDNDSWDTPEEPTETDPYAPGGTSSVDDGQSGTYNYTSNSIAVPSAPSLSAVDSGFITLYNPSDLELIALAGFMWSSATFDVATFQKLFNNPMEAILGLSIVPLPPSVGSASSVKIGNVETNISMSKLNSQYVTFDCGTLTIERFTNSYLDFAPDSKAEIYLPYIGTKAVDMDTIMGKIVSLQYIIDCLSGACIATLSAQVDGGVSVLYSFMGQCSSSIPITGRDFTNALNGVITGAAAIGTTIATGGASAPLTVPQLASAAMNSMKPSVEKSGNLGSGAGGMLGVQTPYFIFTLPNQCLPSRQNEFLGYPIYKTVQLSNLAGYTVLSDFHLNGITGTHEELTEIEKLLKEGVIF